MKLKILACLCALLAISGLPDPLPMATAETGLTVSVHTSKSEYSTKKPVIIYILVMNNSDEGMVVVNHFIPNWTYKLIVRDSKKKELPFPADTPRLKEFTQPGLSYYNLLFPNELFGKAIDLKGWQLQYNLKPDTYSLKAVYSPGEDCKIKDNPGCKSIESNEVRFTVK